MDALSYEYIDKEKTTLLIRVIEQIRRWFYDRCNNSKYYKC
jgi:hypothetical protein